MTGLLASVLIIALALIVHNFVYRSTVRFLGGEAHGMSFNKIILGRKNASQWPLRSEEPSHRPEYSANQNEVKDPVRDLLEKIKAYRASGLPDTEVQTNIELGCNFVSCFQYGGIEFFFEHTERTENLGDYISALNVLGMGNVSAFIESGYQRYKSAFYASENAEMGDEYNKASRLMQDVAKEVDSEIYAVAGDIRAAIERYARLEFPEGLK
jgi:hypothetical protein